MAKQNSQISNKTVLIVDDNENILNYLSDQLQHHGYNIISSMNAEQTMALLENIQPDFALVDIRLPDTNGIDLSKTIAECVPNIIIILMTGYPNLNDALKNVDSHVLDYLIKPFKIQQLLMSFKRAVKYSELIKKTEEQEETIESLKRENSELQEELRKMLSNDIDTKMIDKPKKRNKYLASYKKQQDYNE